MLLPGQVGDDEVGGLSSFAKNGWRSVARGRQRSGTVRHILQPRVEFQSHVDAAVCPAQARAALFQLLHPSVVLVRPIQFATSMGL